jgi:hypothetical protein
MRSWHGRGGERRLHVKRGQRRSHGKRVERVERGQWKQQEAAGCEEKRQQLLPMYGEPLPRLAFCAVQ